MAVLSARPFSTRLRDFDPLLSLRSILLFAIRGKRAGWRGVEGEGRGRASGMTFVMLVLFIGREEEVRLY